MNSWSKIQKGSVTCLSLEGIEDEEAKEWVWPYRKLQKSSIYGIKGIETGGGGGWCGENHRVHIGVE